MNPSIESFGKILIEKVRDEAIYVLNNHIDNESSHAMTAKYLRKMKTHGIDEYHKALIACSVDKVLGYLMIAIDQEMLNLIYTDDNGTAVDLVKEGCGELSG